MIKEIKIKNFQSHKKTTLRLCEGINGIIGIPNSGKTAIIRAIKWAFTNRPAGFQFHSKFSTSKFTSVSIKFDNGSITLKKSEPKSIYKTSSGNENNDYKKFGQQIPDKVKQLININEINFSDQLEGPFLIASTPSEFSRIINKVTKTEEFDKCIAVANKKIGVLKTRKNLIVNNIKEIEKKIAKLKDIDAAKKLIKKAEKLHSKIRTDRRKYEQLTSIIEFIENTLPTIEKQKEINKVKKLILEALQINAKIQKISDTFFTIKRIIELNKQMKSAIMEKKRLIKEYIKELKAIGKCPVCNSTISNQTITKIKREIK